MSHTCFGHAGTSTNPLPPLPLSDPASTLQPDSKVCLLCCLISRHQSTRVSSSLGRERPPPPTRGASPHPPSLVCLQGFPQLPPAFPLLPRGRQREALPPLGSQSTLFHHPHNLIMLLLTVILSTSQSWYHLPLCPRCSAKGLTNDSDGNNCAH